MICISAMKPWRPVRVTIPQGDLSPTGIDSPVNLGRVEKMAFGTGKDRPVLRDNPNR